MTLMLATIGIFGVTSQTAHTRLREIGIRMALGARREQVILLIVWPSIALAGAGAACGVILAIVQSRLLKTLLYGVSPVNPMVLVLASGVLVAVAALAAYLPARTASTADPATVLRQD